jgi:hypothetical protein
VHRADHVEMHGVSTDFESLTDISEFDVLKTRNERIVTL